MKLKCLFILSLCLILTQQSLGQKAFSFFEEKESIPSDLLKNRTVVFMHVKNLDWEKQATIFHQQIRGVGIDAVAYYALSDILSGHDATNSFYNDITERSISSMMIIQEESKNNYIAYIGNIGTNGQFFEKGMKVFKMSGESIENLGERVASKAEQANLERENYLILEVPEVFKRTNVIKSRRVTDYNPDLRIDKLAVPRFESGIMVAENVDSLNAELDSIMKRNYPFEYGLVDPNLTDDQMINLGYLMVLRKLENNVESLKRMLGYEIKDKETIHISTINYPEQRIVKLFSDEMGNKYYIQQLYTKDIYLGNEWDAAISWQDALKNHIANLKAKFKR